jgi:hypothetical protein
MTTFRQRMCRGCGCDDRHACIGPAGPCAWVLLDVETPTGVCSLCAEEMGWDPALLAQGICEEMAAALGELNRSGGLVGA